MGMRTRTGSSFCLLIAIPLLISDRDLCFHRMIPDRAPGNCPGSRGTFGRRQAARQQPYHGRQKIQCAALVVPTNELSSLDLHPEREKVNLVTSGKGNREITLPGWSCSATYLSSVALLLLLLILLELTRFDTQRHSASAI